MVLRAEHRLASSFLILQDVLPWSAAGSFLWPCGKCSTRRRACTWHSTLSKQNSSCGFYPLWVPQVLPLDKQNDLRRELKWLMRKGEEKGFFTGWSVLAPDDKLQQDLSNLSLGRMRIANVFFILLCWTKYICSNCWISKLMEVAHTKTWERESWQFSLLFIVAKMQGAH